MVANKNACLRPGCRASFLTLARTSLLKICTTTVNSLVRRFRQHRNDKRFGYTPRPTIPVSQTFQSTVSNNLIAPSNPNMKLTRQKTRTVAVFSHDSKPKDNMASTASLEANRALITGQRLPSNKKVHSLQRPLVVNAPDVNSEELCSVPFALLPDCEQTYWRNNNKFYLCTTPVWKNPDPLADWLALPKPPMPEQDYATVMTRITVSAKMEQAYRTSTCLGSATESSISMERWDSAHASLPVVKFAMPSPHAMAQTKRERATATALARLEIAPKVDPTALVDENSVFGFRMEMHKKYHFHAVHQRADEAKALIARLHDAG